MEIGIGPSREIPKVQTVGDKADFAALVPHHIEVHFPAVGKPHCPARLKFRPARSAWHAHRERLFRVKYARPRHLFQGIAKTHLRVLERKGADRIALSLPDYGSLRNLLHDDVIVDVHIEEASVLVDIIGQLGRAEDIERFLSVDLTREHENARQSRDVVGVHV